MTVCDCKKSYWHQKLDEASSFLTTFNTEISSGRIKQVIVIADAIMILGKQQNHRDHDVALTILLEIARKYNVKLNFDKLQYKKIEVDFFGETYTTDGHRPFQSKVSAIVEMLAPTCKKQV